MKFLERTAKYIAEHYADKTGELYVVLPNRRAGLFLKRYLTSQMGTTFWAPEIFSIQDFIFNLTGFQIADQHDLTFTLYSLHKSREATKAQPLNDFLKWGSTMLNDFNDVDLYMTDVENLFTYLTEAKAIARWNPDGSPLTDFEKEYLRFYNAMGGYYTELRTLLTKDKKAYPGMAFRMVAENCAQMTASLAGKKIIFAGLNALTPSEETIVRYMVNERKADILWDADEYYLSDKRQEAGRFLRKYLTKWNLPEFNWVDNNFADAGRRICITGIPGNVSQARYAGALLKDYVQENPDAARKIAVVLADEKLLVPVLNSLPAEITKFNITMGYPLKDTPVFSFAEATFAVHVNAAKFGKKAGEKAFCFYAHDLIRLLNHPYMQLLCGTAGDDGLPCSRKVADALTLNNFIFVSPRGIEAEFEKISEGRFATVAALFNIDISDSCSLLKALSSSLQRLRQIISEDDKDRIELEFIFNYYGIINRLLDLFARNAEAVDIKTLQSFLVQMSKAQTIPFYGEPLEGLQLLGLLETRALDFDTVILLSANEGIIPSGKSQNSFVPFDIRVEYGLPVHTEKEAVFAYHFYRLLQHCPDIHYVYNTESDPMGGGEKSRFIEQLLHELPAFNPDIEIVEKVLSLPLQNDLVDSSISIAKSEDTLNRLYEKAKTGFAPSTINAYRSCSLRFYFKEIAGLAETEEIAETVDSATLGTVIHKVLEELFTPFIGLKVTSADVKEMHKIYYSLLSDEFSKIFSGGDMSSGKNLLILKVAALYIFNFISEQQHEVQNFEKQQIQLLIAGLEQKLTVEMPVTSAGRELTVLLKGTIDRIDNVGNGIRIVDYKSGKVSAKDLTLDDWELLRSDSKLDKCLQLLMYSWLYYKQQGNVVSIPAIISFRNISSWAIHVTLPDDEHLNADTLQRFEDILLDILAQIFDPSIPFTQTDKPENCTYCPYISICNR
ncbi:MAG: PD-(D/E)XK nuclease family protein [Bacteroidota bacterium]